MLSKFDNKSAQKTSIFSSKANYTRGLFNLLTLFSAGVVGFFLVTLGSHSPDLPQKGVEGIAKIDISSIKMQKVRGVDTWIYRGRVLNFKGDRIFAKNIPYIFYLKDNPLKERPKGNIIYQIPCILKAYKSGVFWLKTAADISWLPLKKKFSWVEWRFKAKQKVQNYIHNQIVPLKTAKFLSGLLTGEFDDLDLNKDFGRFGLLHLMAISGFHFTIIAMILNGFFGLFLRKETACILLVSVLSFYCFFLGLAPSILRAYVMTILGFIGFLFRREPQGLNSLGVALIVILALDPYVSQTVAFQLSFIMTFALLLFAQESELFLCSFFPNRTFFQLLKMNGVSQHAYVLIRLFKQALAILIAVTLAALPSTLYIFHAFPFFGLIYNLFFPFLVSISLFLLIVGTSLFWIPKIATIFHQINQAYTTFLLQMLTQFPTKWDLVLESSNISKGVIVTYFTFLFFGGIFIKSFKPNDTCININN